MQIGGFVDSDSYEDVLRKASNGLGLPEPSEELVKVMERKNFLRKKKKEKWIVCYSTSTAKC